MHKSLKLTLSLASLLALGQAAYAASPASPVCVADNTVLTAVKDPYGVTNRPAKKERLFQSEAVEKVIKQMKKQLTNRKLAWMFENCFPNTIDTTVHFRTGEDGKPDTFVYTGDIHAMWLRDSAAQVWPYVALANQDEKLREMLEGVIRRQFKCIILDPFANAFNDGPTGGEWMSDYTKMRPEIHERKWEIDSLCYPIRLAYEYWKTTGDASIFDAEWLEAMQAVLDTFRDQQRKEGNGSYFFLRKTDRALDTLNNGGLGAPVKPCGLIVSSFRPSDDATTLQFLVPSNFFAVASLRQAAEILTEVNGNTAMATACTDLADEVKQALDQYAVYQHPKFGPIYAFEVDGFGNQLLMDDSNAPSLLSLAYLCGVDVNDPIYQNTRRFVWSDSNPYFFSGKAAEGIGGPHIGYDMVWPMSIMMRAFTSQDDAEIAECLRMLLATDDETGFIHESFHKDDPSNFTRKWFAWQNTLFGELIIKLVDEGKLNLLNSL
jgi:meiotically up-regulated gene 157 (Mug157) protein